ncbi:hypothetical protein AMTR_s00028p00236360 [Amborella trichopoda]|uniref:Uncharacterized protein n=1 Tax=Amborella trichopoda TaxID=13333 RepID=W1PSL6_AMBTC|nr:hypothetical protein AMTR_s00028p00236360 [Amborella trichopoda]
MSHFVSVLPLPPEARSVDLSVKKRPCSAKLFASTLLENHVRVNGVRRYISKIA